MPTPRIVAEADQGHVAAELAAALVEWNERQVGPRNRQPLTPTIRADNGELLAGLVGEMFWSFLYIEILWVKEGHRRQAYGTALMRQAEAVARERPCAVAFLNTMSFQAPEFYERGGYQRFATLPHAPVECGRIWLAKRLMP